jgi:hypothetical protein
MTVASTAPSTREQILRAAETVFPALGASRILPSPTP